MAEKQRVEVAIALLLQENQFLLQLRDDIPNIIYPGHWAFFGGHIEPGETVEAGVWRELKEEIGYTPPWLKRFERWQDENVIRNVFYGPLTVAVNQLELKEGWDLGLWSIEDIHKGERYSKKANQVRPLGAPHQKILLSFIAQHGTALEA
ncbi:MAG: NUDIX domain-containing protein [Leptolyngbya sp. SIO1D8]|nr:NUDIX domain-containing protein [Leptolyngbya sp. SIO1D8]